MTVHSSYIPETHQNYIRNNVQCTVLETLENNLYVHTAVWKHNTHPKAMQTRQYIHTSLNVLVFLNQWCPF